jgi:hypothetical protein
MSAPSEIPSSSHLAIAILVHDGLMDPSGSVLNLALAIDDSGGFLLADEIDDVGADIQNRDPDST